MEAWIVGAGVIGLTTGVRLLECGFAVKAISRQEVLQTTSVVAAAIWHPYRARDPRLDAWGAASLRRYRELAESAPDAGVDDVLLV
ncbi:MAG: FAD-binding oxidoreductase, partial [Planctomycetota bacterium]|nr:FAD-binding oxidoreductase [Planctomycetota bacterium]